MRLEPSLQSTMMTFYKGHLENDQIRFLHARPQLGRYIMFHLVHLTANYISYKRPVSKPFFLNSMMEITWKCEIQLYPKLKKTTTKKFPVKQNLDIFNTEHCIWRQEMQCSHGTCNESKQASRGRAEVCPAEWMALGVARAFSFAICFVFRLHK